MPNWRLSIGHSTERHKRLIFVNTVQRLAANPVATIKSNRHYSFIRISTVRTSHKLRANYRREKQQRILRFKVYYRSCHPDRFADCN